MKFGSRFGAGLLALILTGPALAQDTLLTGVSIPEILSAARIQGEATLTEQANGDPQITGTIDGLTYHVFFRNCTSNTDCEDLNFYLGFLDLKPKFEVINEWNFGKRFSRAYLDDEQDACVEMDLDLVQGVTAEYLNSQFALWSMVVHQFSQHIGYN